MMNPKNISTLNCGLRDSAIEWRLTKSSGARFPRLFFVKLLLVLIVVATETVFAQDSKPKVDLLERSLEDLMKIEVESVSSASKYSQKVTDAPASISIVTSEEIKKFGYRTLADILRSVRGFYVSYDRNYSYIGTRGFSRPGDYNTRMLLLVDGHRINDNIYDLALLGTELPIEIDLIQRVEVIRGPSSSLYGTSAFFAVVNLITKKGEDLNGTEISTESSSFGTYRGRVSLGRRFRNGLDVVLSGSYYDSDGIQQLYFREFDDPATNNGIAENADRDRAKRYFGTLSYKEFTFRSVYGVREKGVPTGAYDTVFNDARTRTIDHRAYADLQYQHSFSGKLDLNARLHYDVYNYAGNYIYSSDDESRSVVNKDFARGDWWGAEIQLTKVLFRNHKATTGTEYRDNIRQNQQNYDSEPYTLYLDDRRKSRNIAFYLQDEYSIRDNLLLNVGLRYDRNTLFGGTLKPRAGLIYHPAQKSTLKFLYGQAFRAPNIYEMFYYEGDSYKTNPGLRPESISTSEVVFEQYIGDRFRLTASGYVYRIHDLISQRIDPADGLIIFTNAEKVTSQGIEFEAEAKLAKGFESRVSYTLLEARDRFDKETLTNSPKHQGKLNLILPLYKRKFFGGLELQYFSRRKTLFGSELSPYCLSNFTISSRRLFKGLEMSFSIYNMFDQKYADPGAGEHRQDAIEQNGRNLRLRLNYRF